MERILFRLENHGPMPVTTELRWEGKYDANGKPVLPLKVKLPFQTVETINEATPARRTLFRAPAEGQPWRNRLIWGDKRYVLPSLLDEFGGRVNLIYIDPPFDTGADFSFNAKVPEPDGEDADPVAFTKQPSIIEQKAYRDTWGRGLDSYLQWFYETVVLLHELLAENGSIYVHLDWHVVHYAKSILDEVFGSDHFRNEIIWKRTSAHANVINNYGSVHDTLLYYSKSDEWTWNQQYAPYSEEYKALFFDQVDEQGRRYSRRDLTASALRASSGQLYVWKGIKPPPSRVWAMTKERMDELDQQGKIHWPKSKGGMPRLKFYADEAPGIPIQDVWTDLSIMHNLSTERVDYATQKPETLLDRIIKKSSNEGALVLDCFCGSGTTAAVAEKLNRRWVACDLGRFAIHTTRKRLLNIEGVRPFVVQNLGKYERQLWQTGRFALNGPETPEQAAQRNKAYIEFMLKLYNASPLSGRTWLHGVKNGRMIHVGGVEGPVSDGDIRQIAAEFKKVMGSGKHAPTANGIDVLGWDFAFEINEIARQQAERANIVLRFLRIPREVMDKRAVDQGDIHFFELGALAVDVKVKGLDAALKLANFVIPPDDVPEDVQTAVRHWSQWIDYWAVDWEYDGKTFHNQWQSFRTRQQTKLALSVAHTYQEAGTYRVMVKVIDILGNDTTKTLPVEVKDE